MSTVIVTFTSAEEVDTGTITIESSDLPPVSVSVSIRFVGGDTYDLSMPLGEGDGWSRTFTLTCADRPLTRMPDLGAEAANVLLSEVGRRRTMADQEMPPHVPLIEVNRNGDIEQISEGARRALEYSSGDTIPSCFFSHVHERNLERVMWELAQLIEQKMLRTRWLLQLHTGAERYRWFRAKVESVLHGSTVQVFLRPQ